MSLLSDTIFEVEEAMDFFDAHLHPIWYLIGWILFPRIMFWFVSAITGGFGFWLGVFFCPYIMAAYWATHYYWDTNPVLCILVWIYALIGSSGETKTVSTKIK